MTGVINTARVAFDSLPSLWLSDERVQSHLPPQHVLAFVNLIHYAMTLTATTGSEWVDGEFSPSTALKRVRHLTAEALDAMLDAELVKEIDDDRWVVDFVTPQTTHEQLQANADANASRSVTQKTNHFTRKQRLEDKAERLEREREQDRERKRRQREKQKTETPDHSSQAWEAAATLDGLHDFDPWTPVPGQTDKVDPDKCGGCERLIDAHPPERGIGWRFDRTGQPWCSECRPSSYDKPKVKSQTPDCPGCKYHGDKCYVHGSNARARDFSEPVNV